MLVSLKVGLFFFFFNDTATTEIYTLSLHDALPICSRRRCTSGSPRRWWRPRGTTPSRGGGNRGDRESTRLKSSHSQNSYAVFFLKKKKINKCKIISYNSHKHS